MSKHALRPWWILPTIVLGQVLVTSTWFAANAIVPDLSQYWAGREEIGKVTLAVQLGFILGTLLFALTGLADRVSGRLLFFASAQVAAVSNLAILLWPAELQFVMACRVLTGASLAGVYPVGMKIAASWYADGLGRALGYLVAALVLGTSSTHLMRAVQISPSWQTVICLSTICAVIGGCLMLIVIDGPHLRKSNSTFQLQQVVKALEDSRFRASAFSYFGHMWELYAFWAFMPRWIETLSMSSSQTSLACFAVIAAGGLGCAVGGLAAERFSSRRVARCCLAISGICCLLSPIMHGTGTWILMPFLFIWGIAVVGDSPQLSSLTALTAPRNVVGSALTATTCIGFSITVLSLFWLEYVFSQWGASFLFISLAIGPLVGVWYLRFKHSN